MSGSEEHSSDECTPPDLKPATEKTKNNLLPEKSKNSYDAAYETFVKWKRAHKTKFTSESIMLAYFSELAQKYKSSTLWSLYSMLKATLKIKEKIDIDGYHALKAFLKKESSGFKSKKSNVLTSENVEKFLSEAPNTEYLATKVALIFGITGACRSNELVNVKLKDITKQGEMLVVNLPNTKTKKPRTFVIDPNFAKIVQRYMDRRPQNAATERFFLNYQKGKCTSQVIGIHKFSKMPKEIALYLNLDNPASYTGRAFRRTSATLLADSGANIATLKRHGGWESSTVAEGDIEESIQNKSKIGEILSEAVNFSLAGPSRTNTSAPPLKRVKVEATTTPEENTNIESSDSSLDSPRRQNFIFKNCTVNIFQKE